MKPILLASSSPRRAALLRAAGVSFRIVAPQTAELSCGLPPPELALANARAKAQAAALLYPDQTVLGADTIVVCADGAIIGKPRDLADAAAILTRLSGCTHRVMTAVAIHRAADGYADEFTVATAVTFRELDAARIAHYLRLVAVLDKAGAYALQEHGEMLVERLEGDTDNVVGLPVAAVCRALRRVPDLAAR